MTEAEGESSRYRWYVAILLTCFYMMSFVDRLIVGLLVEPIKADLNLSDLQISLLHGFSFALFYTFFGLIMGRLADTMNRRNLIGFGVVAWSLLTIMCGTATRFWHLLVLRVGVGLGEATLTPAAYSIIADYFPPEKRPAALSVFSAGVYLGIALAFIGGAYLYRFFEYWLTSRGGLVLPMMGEVQPWQLVFVAVGLPGLLLSTLLVTVREPRRRHDQVSISAQEGMAETEVEPFKNVVRYFCRNWRTVLGHNMGIALISASAYSRDLWNVAFFERTYGWKLYETGPWYGILVLVAGICGVMLGGRLGNYYARKKIPGGNMKIMFYAALGGIPFGLSYPLMPTPELSLLLIFPAIFTTSMPFGVAAAAVQEMMPSRMRGFGGALMLSANSIIGMGVGPVLVAIMTDRILADEGLLNISLAVVTLAIQLSAALFIFSALKPFKKTLAELGGREVHSQL